jgi:hypothetical protein
MNKIILMILLSSSVAFAQGVLKGTVREEGSNQPLTGAYIFLKETLRGTIAQADGTFMLSNIPAGTHQVEISFVGFAMQTFPIEISSGVLSLPTLYLKAGDIQLADVVISSSMDRPMNTLSPIDIKLSAYQYITGYFKNGTRPIHCTACRRWKSRTNFFAWF